MIFNLLDFQISTPYRVYYFDVASVEIEDNDMADGLYSLFHIAFVDGEWFFDLLWLKNPLKSLFARFIG